MRTNRAKMFLTLLALVATPVAAQAWERGKVERFATLPPGEAHPEGICLDGEGNVYVVTVEAPTPDRRNGTLIVFDAKGKHLRTVRVADSSTMLLDIRFHPETGKLLVVDYGAAKLLTVDAKTGASSVFMTVTGKEPGLDGICFDAAGNVYTTDAHQGIIWKVGKDGGKGMIWVESPLLKPTRPPPAIGANGLCFNNKQTALFVANTAQDTIVRIPVNGASLNPAKPEVFVNRAGGGPDGLIIDEHDNLWIACNQSNEIMVLEPKQGKVIAKLGDFGGIDKDGAPIGFLWSNSLVFHDDDVLVTNLALDVAAFTSPTLRTVDGPWADQVKLHTISKIKKHIPGVPELDKSSKGPDRESDRLAIDKLTRDMVQAFDQRDAAAIAAHWTADGEFLGNGDEPIRGRAEIQKGYAAFFKTLKGKLKLEIQSDAIRFPSADMAVAEVTLRVKNDDGEIVASGRQAIVAVREGSQWKVAMIREWDRDTGLDAGLKDLAWLIGTWRAVTKEREVTITYAWDEHKAFIRGTFTVKEGAKVIDSGTELIGKDPAGGVIRSWVFQSDGGFGRGVWTRDGKQWNVYVQGVKPDGGTLTATVLYILVDANTFPWQAVNQTRNEVPVADTQPIRVTKQKAAQ